MAEALLEAPASSGKAKGKDKGKVPTDPNDFEQFLVRPEEEAETAKEDNFIDMASLGKGIELVSESSVVFNGRTSEKYWKELQVFKQAHPVRKNQVLVLYEAIKGKRFRPEWVNFITAEQGGKTYRINARHTLLAVISFSRNIDKDYAIKVKHQHYKCRTYEDLRILYANCDRNHARTPANIIKAYLEDSLEFGRYPDDVVRLCSDGFAHWQWPSSHDRVKNGPDRRAALMLEKYPNLVHNVAKLLNESKAVPWLKRAGIVAAMYASFNVGVRASDEFWRSVRDASGFKRSREGSKSPMAGGGFRIQHLHDPRQLLRDRLTEVKASSGSSGTRGKRRANAEEMYRWCAYAWNAYQNGDMLSLLRTEYKGERPKFEKPL